MNRLALVALLSVSSVTEAAAQAAVNPQTNPGIVQNQNRQNETQIRQQNEQTLVGPPVAPVNVPKSFVGPPGGKTFVLRKVEFTSTSAFLKQAELDAFVAPYIGRTVDISQIQKLVKAINDDYAAKGIVTASAILPPQDLKGGVLKISLVEGKLEKVRIKGNERLSGDFVRNHIITQPGSPVDVPLLTREVAAFNKTGVAQIQASLQPGSAFGLTDIDLAVLEPPALSVNVFGDNQGIESVGKYEGGFLIQGYAPLGIDDRLTLYGVASRGDLDGNIAYSLPFNNSGGRLGASYTQGQIYVVNGPFAPLGIKGRSDIIAGNAVQPIFVDANWFLLANAAISEYGSSSRQMTTPTTANTTLKESVGFSAGYQNEIFSASVTPSFSPAQTSFDLTNTKQHFSLASGSYAGTLRLPSEFVATVAGVFQYSTASLIAGDQLFQIGGPTTVRGYTTALFAAATGYYANFELHHNANLVLRGLDVFVFYDRGSTYSPSPAVITLNSVGAGLTYDFNQRLLGEVSFGVPLDHPIVGQPGWELYFRLTTKFSSRDLALLNLK